MFCIYFLTEESLLSVFFSTGRGRGRGGKLLKLYLYTLYKQVHVHLRTGGLHVTCMLSNMYVWQNAAVYRFTDLKKKISLLLVPWKSHSFSVHLFITNILLILWGFFQVEEEWQVGEKYWWSLTGLQASLKRLLRNNIYYFLWLLGKSVCIVHLYNFVHLSKLLWSNFLETFLLLLLKNA